MRDRPEVVLTRHFFASLFDFGFLSDDGAEALNGRCSAASPWRWRSAASSSVCSWPSTPSCSAGPLDAYQQAVIADHAFLMAVPMWFVAAAIGLVGESLFPNQSGLPDPDGRAAVAADDLRSEARGAAALRWIVRRRHARGARAARVADDARHVQSGSFVISALAFAVSSALASLFAALAIVAVHGALMLFAPRARLSRSLAQSERDDRNAPALSAVRRSTSGR